MALNYNKPAWRGVVVRGEVWAWPTLVLDHNGAFAAFARLRDYSCRWRQWEPGGKINFDPGCSDEDRAKVEAWVKAASA